MYMAISKLPYKYRCLQIEDFWLSCFQLARRNLHIGCNLGTGALPDMYALRPQAYILVLQACVSGKSLMSMLN